jgi:hypothetical protein
MIVLELTDGEYAALRTLTDPHLRNLAGVGSLDGRGVLLSTTQSGPTLLNMDLRALAAKVERARPVALAR